MTFRSVSSWVFLYNRPSLSEELVLKRSSNRLIRPLFPDADPKVKSFNMDSDEIKKRLVRLRFLYLSPSL